jgi:hypothetical protein
MLPLTPQADAKASVNAFLISQNATPACSRTRCMVEVVTDRRRPASLEIPALDWPTPAVEATFELGEIDQCAIGAACSRS